MNRRLHLCLIAGLLSSSCGASQPASSPNPGGANAGSGSTAPAPASASTAPATASAPASAATPAPTTLSPAADTGVPAAGSMVVRSKAVELKVEGVQTMAEIGGRKARAGYEFVVVDTSWKNIIPLIVVDQKEASRPSGGLGGLARSSAPPPADTGPKSTPYVVPALTNHLWLLTDNRYADTVDLEAQAQAPNHLNNGFGVGEFEEVVRGTIVFEAPANAKYRALQFFDNDHGHIQIPLAGTKPATPATLGALRENEILQIGVSEAGFGPAGQDTPPGLRYYTVGLRGLSKSARDLVHLPLRQIVYLQNDRGCISQPAPDAKELPRPFGETASFLPTSPNEGQVSFLVPEDTKQARLLITPTGSRSLTLAAGPEFRPSWPAPRQTIEDGSTARVLVLPSPQKPAGLPAAEAGHEFVVLDLVIENLKPSQGIDFQTTQQLRLVMPSGGFVSPAPISNQLPCRLGDEGVIPAANARRFQLVFDVPAGMPLKLQYRGFEKDEVIVEVQR